jgi:hypothetical protein
MKWTDDKDTDYCQLCKQVFSISRRKVSKLLICIKIELNVLSQNISRIKQDMKEL